VKPILTILEPEHFSEAALEKLDELFLLQSPECLAERQAEVLWARLGKVDLRLYKNLKLIACNCTDVSHLPLEECQRRNIEILSLKGIEGLNNVHATAEHTISLMLQALRYWCDRSSGRIGRELHGKKVCIVGYGRIGQLVSRKIHLGFGVETYCATKEHFCIERSDLWKRYDIVSIHASLNETSKGMVNAEFLSKLKPGAIVVNTARHAIVDERAIIEWLDRDSEAIYAHDFGDEWPPGSFEYLGRRIISTPHIGGWTIESLHKTEELLAEKVIEWAKEHAEQTKAVSSVR
jgi:lactate dehydrogenase-like 2-hydroxyacid dehydrogenase